eukprot:c25261_g1_i4 orf=241-894(+)
MFFSFFCTHLAYANRNAELFVFWRRKICEVREMAAAFCRAGGGATASLFCSKPRPPTRTFIVITTALRINSRAFSDWYINRLCSHPGLNCLSLRCLRSLPSAFHSQAMPVSHSTRMFSVKATDVSGPDSIDSSLITSMKDKIREQLNAEEIVVKDAYGDGRHVSIDVVSVAFEGLSQVNRQRMVYKAIWEELQNTVHAVDQMRTRTPAEAAQEAPNK